VGIELTQNGNRVVSMYKTLFELALSIYRATLVQDKKYHLQYTRIQEQEIIAR